VRRGEAAGRPFSPRGCLRGAPGGAQNGGVDAIGWALNGLVGAWDRAWLAVVMGMGLVMAYVLHRGRPPDEK
jgi:hypothetical protein